MRYWLPNFSYVFPLFTIRYTISFSPLNIETPLIEEVQELSFFCKNIFINGNGYRESRYLVAQVWVGLILEAKKGNLIFMGYLLEHTYQDNAILHLFFNSKDLIDALVQKRNIL